MADMRAKYETLDLATLKTLAKGRKIKVTGLKKEDLIEAMLEKDKQDEAEGHPVEVKPVLKTESAPADKPQPAKEYSAKEGYTDRDDIPAELDSGIRVKGILEVMSDGFGFIRSANYMPGDNDIYVAPGQIRRFNLKTGDIVEGNTRIKTQNEKFSALLYVKSVNDLPPEVTARRKPFEDMTPIFPDEKLKLETGRSSIAMRRVTV